MKCPECEFDNREEARFCSECGYKFELICPDCKATNRAGAKFCDECGCSFSSPSPPLPKDLSLDDKLAKIQKYLPKGLTEKILAQKDRIEGERKTVTVMFCDLEGFTPLVESLGPEEAYSIMDQVYEILIHKVHDYEGTVNEMTGDGIMALFGAPIALEDAPQRAIRSSLAIHREMSRFNDKMKEDGRDLPPLKMRIGIHTGPVVVGTMGNDLRVEFKAVGDTVNIASRMEGLAEPGTAYISEDTFKLTEGLFRVENLGEKAIKGREEPVPVFRVIAPSTQRTRFDVSAERGLTPFVGRERELEILLDGFERCKSNRGQAISIISEAGVGKSRLLYEFRKAVAHEDVTFLEGKCLSFGRSQTYHPIIDVLKSNFDIQEGDGDLVIRDKVQRWLKNAGMDEASTLPYLLDLLSIKDAGIDQTKISPEGKKDKFIEALKRIVLKSSEVRPLILAFEDLHWSDDSSEEVMKYILESIAGARVFLIFTYRPEFVHTWGARSYHSQVTLNRLSNRESLSMTAHVLETEDIDPAFADLILEKTEGVPFFIEEFVKSLQELRLIERKDNKYQLVEDIQQMAVPSSIHAVIMARVDALPDRAKEVLQTGSVIEREFSYELIKLVTGLPEQELLSHLSALKDSELLYERGIFPETTFIFKHALTREVVYDSILATRNKKIHNEIGLAMEVLYPETIREHCGRLAEHFVAGDNYEKGAVYCEMAARQARRKPAFKDAIYYAEKWVICIERLPETGDFQKKLIDARTWLGQYYMMMNYHAESMEAIDPIIDLAIRIDYKRRLPQIYTIAGMYYGAIKGDISKSRSHLEDAVKIAEEINDFGSISLANMFLGVILHFLCEFEKSLYYFNKALDISVAAKSLWGISQIKSMISYYVYFHQGKGNLGYELSKEVMQMAEESGDPHTKGISYTCHGYSCFTKGYLKEAVQYLTQGAGFFERINQYQWNRVAQLALGDIAFEMKEYKKAESHYNQALKLRTLAQINRLFAPTCETGLARAKARNQEKGIDLETLFDLAKNNKALADEGEAAKHISEILLGLADQHMDDQHMSEAEVWIQKAIEADTRNGMRWHLAKDYASYAELFKRKGDLGKARENQGKAIEIFEECGSDGWVERAEEKLAAIS